LYLAEEATQSYGKGRTDMNYTRLPNDLPKTLRKYGLKVTEVDGWQSRGRPVSTGGFDPVGVLCHHTATGKNWTDEAVVKLLVNGRSDLPGPLVQFGLSRDGTVYLVASGRCNHAGVAKASGSVAAGDGNNLYIGIEGFNDGMGEPWSRIQYDAYVLLSAVLSVEITKTSAQTVRGHKETSVTGKPDPKFDMDDFRKAVAAKMVAIKSNEGDKEDIVASKPGPTLTHPGTLGKTVEYKVPLSKPVALEKLKTYTAATIVIPSGGVYLVTLQTRMPANETTEAEMEFVRLGWPGLDKEDSTGHNHIPHSEKWASTWHRWRTMNHAIAGGGPLAYNIILDAAYSEMRFVAKATRIA
jgi:hypothetical protein